MNDMVTVSAKRNRTYARKFPHDEAIARRANGEGITALAREYGVSHTAVLRVVNPEQRRRLAENTRRHLMSGTCIDCGREGVSIHQRRPEGTRCKDCWAIASATSARVDTLHCPGCDQWKPDDEFHRTKAGRPSRRFRHNFCKKCNNEKRREYRNRHKVLCEGGCGRMVEGKGRPNTNTGKDGRKKISASRPHLCQACWHNQFVEGGDMAGTTQFLILVEESPDHWTVVAKQNVSSRSEAIQRAFPNGNVPEARVVVVSGSAFRPGRLVPIQTYALEVEAGEAE